MYLVFVMVETSVSYLISDLSTELNITLNTTGPSDTRIVEYRIISATVGCRVWDELNQKWDKSHCEVFINCFNSL